MKDIVDFFEYLYRCSLLGNIGRSAITDRFGWKGVRKGISAPLELSLHACVYTLYLYAILPNHPLTLPTSIGAGVSFAIYATMDRFIEQR